MTSVVIVGGGHNALTAAAYLARAGVEVTVLERLDNVGGAAISATAFTGLDARLSRYAYLVSLLPRSIADDLGLDVSLVRRRYSSYTPLPGTDRGLLIDNGDEAATRGSFASVGAAGDAARFADFYRRISAFAAPLFDTMTGPLPTRDQAKSLLGAEWSPFVERPIGEAIEAAVADDLVRGVIATDALIGTFTDLHEAIDGNRCLLYHVIGGGTGDWDVPIGGMGVVSGGMERAARAAGAKLVTGAEVTAIDPDGAVEYVRGEQQHRVTADLVLAGVAPGVLARLLGETPTVRAEGAQVGALKIDRTENENTSTANDIIGGIVAAALSTCFVAILLELVFPRATASAAGMLHQRPMPLWVSGLLGTVAVAPAVLLLIISIAGLSLAAALMCGVIGIALVSAAFTGTAVARMVGHNQNRYAMAAVGGIVAGALTALPLMGNFVSGVAFVFTLGYVIQIIWRNAHLKPQQPANTPGLPTA